MRGINSWRPKPPETTQASTPAERLCAKQGCWEYRHIYCEPTATPEGAMAASAPSAAAVGGGRFEGSERAGSSDCAVRAVTCAYTSATGRACGNPQDVFKGVKGLWCMHHTCGGCGGAKPSQRVACDACLAKLAAVSDACIGDGKAYDVPSSVVSTDNCVVPAAHPVGGGDGAESGGQGDQSRVQDRSAPPPPPEGDDAGVAPDYVRVHHLVVGSPTAPTSIGEETECGECALGPSTPRSHHSRPAPANLRPTTPHKLPQ
jgi:hypothetical protein